MADSLPPGYDVLTGETPESGREFEFAVTNIQDVDGNFYETSFEGLKFSVDENDLQAADYVTVVIDHPERGLIYRHFDGPFEDWEDFYDAIEDYCEFGTP